MSKDKERKRPDEVYVLAERLQLTIKVLYAKYYGELQTLGGPSPETQKLITEKEAELGELLDQYAN